MRISRVAHGDRIVWGRVDDDGQFCLPLHGDVFAGTATDAGEAPITLSGLRLLPPVEPSKIIAVGRNYADHAAELALDVAERPRIFLKPPSSLVGHGGAIHYPSQSSEVHYEAELAVVIGKRCRSTSDAEALEYVLGYTCANDVTARDIQRAEGLPSYAKSFDTFCPLGPWIETQFDPSRAGLSCTINGELRQEGNTGQMLWSVAELIAYVSAAMTLLPGDVLLTGTPAGVGPIHPRDEVTVTIEGIGSLTNSVRAAGQD